MFPWGSAQSAVVVVLCYLYVAVASAFIPCVHAAATLLDPCMYIVIHFLQSLSVVLHLCLKRCTLLANNGCQCNYYICNVCVCVYVHILNLPVSGMCIVSRLYVRDFPHLSPNCVRLPLCCGESISEGRFPKCVWVCVSGRG